MLKLSLLKHVTRAFRSVPTACPEGKRVKSLPDGDNALAIAWNVRKDYHGDASVGFYASGSHETIRASCHLIA
jgi:hypothetical protein